MSVLIDSNIAIYLRDGDEPIVARIDELPHRPVISIITHIELEGGVHRNPALAEIRRTRLTRMLESIQVVPVYLPIVAVYGEIVRDGGYNRRLILDRLIAATAIVHDFTLITINADDFRDIPGLKLVALPAPQ